MGAKMGNPAGGTLTDGDPSQPPPGIAIESQAASTAVVPTTTRAQVCQTNSETYLIQQVDNRHTTLLEHAAYSLLCSTLVRNNRTHPTALQQ